MLDALFFFGLPGYDVERVLYIQVHVCSFYFFFSMPVGVCIGLAKYLSGVNELRDNGHPVFSIYLRVLRFCFSFCVFFFGGIPFGGTC